MMSLPNLINRQHQLLKIIVQREARPLVLRRTFQKNYLLMTVY